MLNYAYSMLSVVCEGAIFQSIAERLWYGWRIVMQGAGDKDLDVKQECKLGDVYWNRIDFLCGNTTNNIAFPLPFVPEYLRAYSAVQRT